MLSVCGWYIYGTRRKEAWKYAVESITKVAEYAKDKVAMLCLEPTAADSNLVEGCDDAISMMEDINMDNVKLMSDTAHVVYRNEVPSDYVYTMRKDLKHVHVTDYDPKEPGTTRCDFLPIMQALKDIEFNGYITIESGFASRSSHADSIARIALEHLKAIEKKMIIGDCFIQE